MTKSEAATDFAIKSGQSVGKAGGLQEAGVTNLVLIALVFVGQTLNVVGSNDCKEDIRLGWRRYCQVVGRPVADPVLDDRGDVLIYVVDKDCWTGGLTYAPGRVSNPSIRLYPRYLAKYREDMRSCVVAHEFLHYLGGLHDHPLDKDYGCVMGNFPKYGWKPRLCKSCKEAIDAHGLRQDGL